MSRPITFDYNVDRTSPAAASAFGRRSDARRRAKIAKQEKLERERRLAARYAKRSIAVRVPL